MTIPAQSERAAGVERASARIRHTFRASRGIYPGVAGRNFPQLAAMHFRVIAGADPSDTSVTDARDRITHELVQEGWREDIVAPFLEAAAEIALQSIYGSVPPPRT